MRTLIGGLGTALLAAVVIFGVSGCGGGGSATGSMGLYVMDAFSDEHPQVWATLYRIEVASDAGTWRAVFDDSEGLAFNLPELANEAAFLGSADLPAALYTRARLTLGNTLRLVDRNGNGSDAPLMLGGGNGFGPAGNGTCTVEFPIDCTVGDNGQSDLVVDFDLPNFERVGAEIRARIQQGDRNRFHAMRKHGRLLGRITNLEPAVGFDLVQPSGRVVRVALNDSTVIVSAANGSEITLANDQVVFVMGTWDPDARILTASVVLVIDLPAGLPRPSHVRGTVTEVNAGERSFVVEPANAFMGFRPMEKKVKVTTSAITVFSFIPRAPATFEDISVGAKVDVVGAYDAASKAMVARRVIIKR